MPSFSILIDFQNKRFLTRVFKGSETIGELMKLPPSETSSLAASRHVVCLWKGLRSVHRCFCSTLHL